MASARSFILTMIGNRTHFPRHTKTIFFCLVTRVLEVVMVFFVTTHFNELDHVLLSLLTFDIREKSLRT